MPDIGPADIWFDPRQILPAAKNALLYPATHPGETAQFGLSLAPGSGEAMSAVDAWNASGRAGNALLSGDYGQAAGEYGNVLLGTLGAIPGAGVIARGTKRGAAWMDRNLPAGVNRLLDAAMPKDASRTMFSGVGPTADLPMDEASQMARAKEMGYADEPFYRGEATGVLPDSYHDAYFSRDPEYAKGFAQRGGQSDPREFRLDVRNAFSDAEPMTASQYGKLVESAAVTDPELAHNLAESIAPGKGVNWLLGFAKAKPDFEVVAQGSAPLVRHAIEVGASNPMGVFKAAGYDALDSGRDVRKLVGQGIRLKDARFDPAKATSSDVLASVAGASLLPAYLLAGQSTSRQD